MTLLKKNSLIAVICLFIINGFYCEVKSQLSQSNPYAVLKGYKRDHVLNDTTGKLLGYIYVKENPHYKNGVLSALLVVKAIGSKLDTLYKINSRGFYNSRGKAELVNHVKDDHGFRLYKAHKNDTDEFSIGDVDSNGKLYSDDNDFLIDWDYKKKVFYYYPMP